MLVLFNAMLADTLFYSSLIGLCASTVFLGLVFTAAVVRFFASYARKTAAETDAPFQPVTIFKPLHGLEPLLAQALESFFVQDYPVFELIFGARTADDPALQIVKILQKKYPHIPTRIILSGEPDYPNAKVFALEKMIAAASHPILVLTDSDVRVTPDYLKRVVRPLLDSSVGLVTCIYRGVPVGGLWSRLEAMGMSVEMSSGVLVANLLEGMKFALGPTMALSAGDLSKLGGIRVLRDYCADDFVLGSLIAASGKRVVLSDHVIDHIVVNKSARLSLLHQVRWMKSSRFSRRLGHIGSGLTFAMPFGLLGLLAGWMRGDWVLGLGLLAAAYLNRVIQSLVVGWGVVRDRNSLWFCWLYPARDLLGFFLWCASFVGSEIVWRGERYRLIADGKIIRKSGPPCPAPKPQNVTA